MDVVNDVSSGTVTKRAQTNAERHQLRREADLLRVVAHPGVVHCVTVGAGDPPDSLILRRVAGDDLSHLGPQPLQVVAGLGAAIATTVADLHDLGVYHGAIEAAHVLLDEEGRPVLCSFGRAEREVPPGRAQTLRRQDTRDLARLLLNYLAAPAPPGVGRTLRRAAGPGRQRRSGEARWLAHQLSDRVPGARLPQLARSLAPEQGGLPPPDEPPPPSTAPARRERRRRARPFAALVMATGLGLVGFAVRAAPSTTSRPPADRQSSCPAVDLGCAPLPLPGGVLATTGGRYLVGQMGDLVVVGRWRCGVTGLPAVLRPRTGQLWTFNAWPGPGQPKVGQLVASHLAGAASMRVLVQRTSCDRIEIERHGAGSIVVDVSRR